MIGRRHGLRVGYFTDTYDPEINGVVYSIHQFEQELERRGHKVFVYATKTPGHKDTRPRVVRFPSIPSLLYPGIRLALPNIPRLLLRSLPKAKLDLIHSHTPILGPLAEFAALRLGIPHVHTYHTMIDEYVDIYVPGWKKLNRKVIRGAMRLLCNRCDYVIAPSRKVEKRLRRLGVTTPIEIIPTGVRLKEFHKIHRGAFRQRFALPAEAPVIINVGRVGEEKSLAHLLRAFPLIVKKHPDARLVFVGQGPYLDELKRLADRLKVTDRIVFTGFLDRRGVAEAMSDSDVFVFPSRTDTQGLVLLEAAAAGLPLVVCETDISDIIVPGETTLVAKHRPGDIAKKVNELLKEPAIAARMGRAAKHLAEEFTAEKETEKLEFLYRKLTDR
jgi:1,2-diacylglycerol 3-alpha-glucosyltransferase